MEYNTTRNHLIMREYGRHIQKMIAYVLTIEDTAIRQYHAQTAIELMGVLNPHLKNVEDFRHKLWDHLFLISDFKLEVESPYPIPTRESLKGKTVKLQYPKRHPRYAHLGKNLELIISKALEEKETAKKEGFAQAIAYYMKLTYNNWHKENVSDDAIRNELTSITNNQLDLANTPLTYRTKNINDYKGNRHNQHPKQNPNNKNRNKNNNNNGNNKNKWRK